MANPTTNYGFVLPTATDLVTDLPADFDVALQGVDTRLKALQPGTTLGDLVYSSATANTNTRLGIGSTSQVLTVTGGVPVWATPTAAGFVGCSVYKVTTSQSIANDTDTNVTFNAEEYDTNTFHDNTTNSDRITIPSGKAGKYLLQTAILFATSSSGVRNVGFVLNGATTLGSALVVPLSSFLTRVAHLYVCDLAVGDYVTVSVNQNSGGSLNVSASQQYTRFTATYLGA